MALLLACASGIAVGIESWSAVSSTDYARLLVQEHCRNEAISDPAAPPGKPLCPEHYERVATSSRANHYPALVAFTSGALAGALLVVLVRPLRSHPGDAALPVAT